MVREVEENAACVEVGELEGVGVGLDQAVHQADHQKGAGDFLVDLLEENLQVHLPGYLMEKKERKLKFKSNTGCTINCTIKTMSSSRIYL